MKPSGKQEGLGSRMASQEPAVPKTTAMGLLKDGVGSFENSEGTSQKREREPPTDLPPTEEDDPSCEPQTELRSQTPIKSPGP